MWFSFVLMVSLLAAKYLVCGVNDMLAVGRQPVNVTVEIPKNATSAQVTQILYQAGAIRDEKLFQLFSKTDKSPENIRRRQLSDHDRHGLRGTDQFHSVAAEPCGHGEDHVYRGNERPGNRRKA